MTEKFIWGCEDSEQVEAGDSCRNPYGCHCREITELVRDHDASDARIADLENALQGMIDLNLSGVTCIALARKVLKGPEA
ncbi:hypothetical protein [Acetobacter oryzifermentans]|uniref:Ferredoxin n=1 Tax=Acetobacter oryzifermentans TaxID=1633874 RepID=A0ABM6AHB5_9PROT|nr:hypothetical protein [Acetobacter oryzifermentans]ANA13105.1 hypothetical protein WG31_03020 [Acetobacter oryzifermentans]